MLNSWVLFKIIFLNRNGKKFINYRTSKFLLVYHPQDRQKRSYSDLGAPQYKWLRLRGPPIFARSLLFVSSTNKPVYGFFIILHWVHIMDTIERKYDDLRR